jgi:hypothetical protein
VETRKQTRTNEKEEREVCRQIGEQKVVEKVSRDLASGKEDKQRDLVNLKEEEAEAFTGKFQEMQLEFEKTWGQLGKKALK